VGGGSTIRILGLRREERRNSIPDRFQPFNGLFTQSFVVGSLEQLLFKLVENVQQVVVSPLLLLLVGGGMQLRLLTMRRQAGRRHLSFHLRLRAGSTVAVHNCRQVGLWRPLKRI
jgi:hypothetical protein